MPRRVLATSILLATLCAVGFLLRTTNAATVFVGDAVVFPENDPYYHMRRVSQILADYPRVPSFDAWIDYPRGAPVVFAPLFDLGVATLAKLAGLAPADRRAIEVFAALVPPILGALTCLPVFWLAAQTTSRPAALLAAVLATLTPAHIWYSRLGFVDHHVAVTLVQVTMCALVLRALAVRPSAAGTAAKEVRVGFAALATLALALGVLLWNGYLLLVALLDVCLIVGFLAGNDARRRQIAGLACAMHLACALLVLPVVVDTVRGTRAAWSSVTLSYLHVVVLAAFGALAWIAARHVRYGLRQLFAVVVVLAVGAVGALLLERSADVGLVPWLLASDPFMGSVQESVSILLTSDGRLDLGGAQIWMSRFFFVVPVLLVLLARRMIHGRFSDEGRTFVLVWATLLFALTLRQRRFGEVATPALAVLVADFLVEGSRFARVRLRERGMSRGAAHALAVGAVLLLVVAAFEPYYRGFLASPDRLTAFARVPLRTGSGSAASGADSAEQEESSDVRLHRTLTRFATLPRAAAKADGAPATPEGAMNPWPLGHKLLYVANVPVTATPFGSYVGGSAFTDAIDFFLATDEERALGILERRGSRWVVVDNDLGMLGAAIVGRGENPREYYDKRESDGAVTYTFRTPLIHSLYFRLTRLGGTEARVEGGDLPQDLVPALDHLRLVIDSSNDDVIGFAKVYEVVRGAVLVVRGAPYKVVRARYAYRSDAGRARVYEKSAVTDARGEARLVLPYSSERADLSQTSSWQIEGGDRTGTLRVREDDVREGRELSLTLE